MVGCLFISFWFGLEIVNVGSEFDNLILVTVVKGKAC